ncbi:MAG: sensor histidine kinase, partial [Thiotrichaceae bacterium]
TQISSETTNLANVLKQLESRFSDTTLQLDYQPDELDVSVKIATHQLKIILNNLFDNSLKHQANLVKISATQQDEIITLLVHDNGAGVSPANHGRVFTPFFTTRRENGGTGLGLGIVESLLKVWNGEIELLDSEDGALFRITLFSATS